MIAAKGYQVELGHQAIDWGADLVLGHHPHVLQEIEVYKGRLIAYSLGNFVFGSQSNRTNTSMILLCTFKGKSLVRVEAVPLDVNNYRVEYQPRVLRGRAAAAVLNDINKASKRFKTRLAITGDRGRWRLLLQRLVIDLEFCSRPQLLEPLVMTRFLLFPATICREFPG